jgi:hypothetical protein
MKRKLAYKTYGYKWKSHGEVGKEEVTMKLEKNQDQQRSKML